MTHRRRSIRLRNYDYASAGAYFVTICTHERICVLGDVVQGEVVLSPFGQVVAQCWQALPAHFPQVELDASVIMPNHVHGIIVIVEASQSAHAAQASPLPRKPAGPGHGSLGAIVGSFKSAVTVRINALRGTPGLPVWQRNYYEHVIRGEDSLAGVRSYIEQNPARWLEDEYGPRIAVPG